jgi:hypothetical protein
MPTPAETNAVNMNPEETSCSLSYSAGFIRLTPFPSPPGRLMRNKPCAPAATRREHAGS